MDSDSATELRQLIDRLNRENGQIFWLVFFFQEEDGIRDLTVTGVQTCALPISTATELLKPWPLKVILDHVILDKPLSRALRWLPHAVADDKVRLLVAASGGMLLIALCAGLFSYAQIFITSSIGYRMVYALRRELFAHLQTLSLSFHNQSRSGDLLTKIAGDTNTLKDIFADSIL